MHAWARRTQWWNIYENEKKSVNSKALNCFTMKESDNTKNLGSTVIPKARGVPKSLFRVSTLKETEDISVSLPCVRRAVHYHFLTFVCLRRSPVDVGKAWKTKLTQQWIACSWRIRWCKLHLGRGLHLYVMIVLLTPVVYCHCTN